MAILDIVAVAAVLELVLRLEDIQKNKNIALFLELIFDSIVSDSHNLDYEAQTLLTVKELSALKVLI